MVKWGITMIIEKIPKPIYGNKIVPHELLTFWIRMEKLFDREITANEIAVLARRMDELEKEGN